MVVLFPHRKFKNETEMVRRVLTNVVIITILNEHLSGMQHSRGIQGVASVDGGAIEGYETSGFHIQKNRQSHSKRSNITLNKT